LTHSPNPIILFCRQYFLQEVSVRFYFLVNITAGKVSINFTGYVLEVRPLSVQLEYVGSWVFGSISASAPWKGVLWPTPYRTHPVWVAAVALEVTGLVHISSECRTGGPREGTCRFTGDKGFHILRLLFMPTYRMLNRNILVDW